MSLWPSSALSICQYTNRHPVHLSDFFIVSCSLLTMLKNETVSTQLVAIWSYVCLRVCLGVRVRGKVCHLRLPCLYAACQSALSLWLRGSGTSPPLSISVKRANKHTLSCTRLHIQPVRYLTLPFHYPVDREKGISIWTEGPALYRDEQDGLGFCVLVSRD